MNVWFIKDESVVHTKAGVRPGSPEPAPLLDPTELLGLERRGLLTPTFRRLEPARQHAVLLAALEEMSTSGPRHFRVKEAARAAGVSVGSLYQYFGSRQGLVDLAVTVLGERLAAELRGYAPLLAQLPLADALGAWVIGGVEWSRERAAMMRAFARAAYDGTADETAGPAAAPTAPDPDVLVGPVADAMLDAVRTVLAAARDRGEVRADVDLEGTARAVHAMLCAVTDAHLLPHLGRYYQPSAPQDAFERTVTAAIGLVVAGLAP